MTEPVTYKVRLPEGYHIKLDVDTLIRWIIQNNIKDNEWNFIDTKWDCASRPCLEFKYARDAIALKLKFGL